MKIPEVLQTGIERSISRISLIRPLVTVLRSHKENVFLAAALVATPLFIWGLGYMGEGDIAIQRMLPKVIIAEIASLILAVPCAYLSARAEQRKN